MGGEEDVPLGSELLGPGGRSIVTAVRLDQRFSYCLYAPPELPRGAAFRNLLVYVHGHGRRFQYLLNALRPIARECALMVLCPLFPANVRRDGNLEGYKYLEEEGVRYDEVLLDMIGEVRGAFPFAEERTLLGGFSGGAQFAHRFAFLHARAVSAVSIASPGTVTLPDPDLAWWPGLSDVDERFRVVPDLEALRQVKMQLVVGANENEEEAGVSPMSRYWSDDAMRAGANRIERLETLGRALDGLGISARVDIVPSAGHKFSELLPQIEDFFRRVCSCAPNGSN
jgi:pimeloyl-ACP methyl ester carboxylesterase